MARISTYNIDQKVVAEDKWIGTDSNGAITKNFSAQGVANFLNEAGAIAVAGQNNFFFQTDLSNGRSEGTISFTNGGGVNTAFNILTTIKVSKYASSGNIVLNYLETLVDKAVFIAQTDNVNNFGVYKLLSLDQDLLEPDFYNAVFQTIEANGSLLSNKFYVFSVYPGFISAPFMPFIPTQTSDLVNDGEDGIHPFITAEDIPPSASTLNDVLTNGNTSLLDAKVGTLGLWDTSNSYYNKIGSIGNAFYFMRNDGAALFVTEAGYSRLSTDYGTLELSNAGIIGSKTINWPDASGTVALISDIPANQNLQSVTDEGNTTTNQIIVESGQYKNSVGIADVRTENTTTGASIYLSTDDGIVISNASSSGRIKADNIALGNNPDFQLPNKSGVFTIATIDDIPTVGTWGALNYPAWTTGTPFVKMTAVGTFSLDTNTYLTGITSSDVTTALGYTPVTNARTLTINGVTYDLTADRSWTIPTNAGTVTSVGLSMPPAFTVSSSPITSAGTIAVAAAGTSAQYIRGDGQLATLPSSGGGGGSSVNYYLNGSIAASVATYKQLSNTAVIGAGTDFAITGNGLITQFLTDIGNPNRIQIPGGAWNFEMFFSMSSNGGTPKFYVELLKYDGVTFTTIANSSAVPETITGGTSIDLYLTSLAVPTTTLLSTDRLAIRVYVVGNSGGRTATLHTEDNHLCEIITTFSGGVTSLNGLTANTQYLAVGTTGTDFNISSVSETHTFNLPTASATNRGALSTTDWSAFNAKQNALTNPITGTGTTNYLPKFTGASTLGNSSIQDSGSLVTITNPTTIGATGIAVGNIALNVRGNIVANSGASAYVTMGTDASNYSMITGTGNGLNLRTAGSFAAANGRILLEPQVNSNILYYPTGTGVHIFYTATNERMRIDAAGNLGIGTSSPNVSSILDLTSTTKGFLPPRMTTVQKNAIATPAEGLVVYDTTLSTLFQYNNSNWIKLTSGIHTNIKPTSGNSTTTNINGTASTTAATSVNRIHLLPYVPAQTITSNFLNINVTAGVATAVARILIYSDLNGVPNTKLYESAPLACSTTSQKSVTTAFTFKAGTTYWIGTHAGGASCTVAAFFVASLMPIGLIGAGTNASSITDSTYFFGSAPATFGSTYAMAALTTPFVTITL
jgi:hypothetical protein